MAHDKERGNILSNTNNLGEKLFNTKEEVIAEYRRLLNEMEPEMLVDNAWNDEDFDEDLEYEWTEADVYKAFLESLYNHWNLLTEHKRGEKHAKK